MRNSRSHLPEFLRVVMICQGYFPLVGGAERQITAVSQELARQGVDIHVLTRHFRGLLPVEEISGVMVHRLPAPQPKTLASLSFTINALPLIRRLRPDVLHAHELLSPTTTAVTAGGIYKIPVVATIHGGGEINRLQQKAFGNWRLRIFRSKVDRFITIDSDIDEQLAYLGISNQRRIRVPNGVDVEHFCPVNASQKERLKADLHLPEGPLVVFTGRLVPLKRVDQLIVAWGRVHKDFPNATLLIIGGGPEEFALKCAAYPNQTVSVDPQNDFGTGIRFLGEIRDVAPYLQASDLFVFPSSREGLSVSLLEAMSCGLATIATDVGGNVDLIQHQQTGWLVSGETDGGFPARLADAMCKLLANEPLRLGISKTCREFIVQSFSLVNVAKQLHELYITLGKSMSHDLPNSQSRRGE